MSGIVRGARRPPGWIAPGPRPAEPAPAATFVGDGEDLCWLAGDWRIVQRLDGHRWSLDDLVTAWFAAREVSVPPARALDLGCGIGTVLMFTAWRFPAARCLGVEAQALSAGLARRSLAWNGAADRCEIRLGDFRDPALTPEGAVFDLITGTPPYFAPGSGTESDHVQRAPCRFEHRGGVEDYCLAAGRLLSPTGVFVACESGSQHPRIAAAAVGAGLTLTRTRDVIPRSGKPPLLSLFALRRTPAPLTRDPPLIVRDQTGQRTAEFVALRGDMGMPP